MRRLESESETSVCLTGLASAALESLSEQPYVVLRVRKHPPPLLFGKDLDILCADDEAAAESIMVAFKSPVRNMGCAVISDSRETGHRVVDVIRGQQLVLRFDLTSRLPYRSRFPLVDQAEQLLLDRRHIIPFPGLEPLVVACPREPYDSVLRYLEYSFSHRNGVEVKVRHLKTVRDNLRANLGFSDFFTALNCLVARP
mgnify:CR=1 FL=1